MHLVALRPDPKTNPILVYGCRETTVALHLENLITITEYDYVDLDAESKTLSTAGVVNLWPEHSFHRV